MIWILGGLALLGAWRAMAKPSGPPLPPITLPGLRAGAWYRIAIRTTLDRRVFGDDAAGQHIQAALGRQDFDARKTFPDAADPFVYHTTGLFRGTRGGLADVPGVILLQAVETSPIASELAHVDARPLPLEPGGRYFARASLSWPATMFVTHDRVAAALAKEGGAEIEVYTDAGQLPDAWPNGERGGDLFVAATYQGAPRAMPLPKQVISVWRE